MVRGTHILLLLVPLAALGCCTFADSAQAAVNCDKYASPSGSDSSATGSLARPYLTVNQLDAALSPGQTGCLRAGTYGNTSTWDDIATSGTSGHPITITSYPGESAQVNGWVDVKGNYTTLTGLTIDGSNTLYSNPGGPCPGPASQPLTLDGQNDIFQYNDFTQSVASLRGVAVGIGFGGGSQGNNTIVRYNKIHDVGSCQAYDHLIYLSHGNGVQIYDNWLWNNPNGWGVQVYPGATNADIYNNVIDAAGSGFVIGGATTVSGNQIHNNVVMNSTGLVDAGTTGAGLTECCGLGTGNTFQNNDVYNNPAGVGTDPGVTMSGNITTNPGLVNSAAHNYAPAAGSPLASWNLWNGTSAGSTSTTPTPAPATPAVPVGAAAVGGNGQVTVNWTADPAGSQVTNYNVYRVGQTFTAPWATPTGTTFTNASTIVNGTQYCYQVSATNAAGESAKTAAVCATPNAPIA
jgi:hypothetical protein